MASRAKWTKDPDLQTQVDLAWKMRLEGGSYPTILASTGAFCARSTLATMFGNPVYCGFPRWYLNHYNLEVADCIDRRPVVEPYVSIPAWLRVQDLGGDNPRSQFGGWPLSGMMSCGHCGSSAWAWAYTGSRLCDVCGERWPQPTAECPHCGADYSSRYGVHRYLCSARQANASRCPQSRYTAGQKLERNLLNSILQHFTPERVRECIEEINHALAARHRVRERLRVELEKDLDEATTAAGRLLEVIEGGGISSMIVERLHAREQEITEIKSRLAALPSAGSLPYLAVEDASSWNKFFQEDLRTLSRRETRRFFQALGMHVTLYREHAKARIDWPPMHLFVPTLTVSYMPPDGLEPPTPGLGNLRSVH